MRTHHWRPLTAVLGFLGLVATFFALPTPMASAAESVVGNPGPFTITIIGGQLTVNDSGEIDPDTGEPIPASLSQDLTPAELPQCSDGVDNDDDGTVDGDDDSCTSPEDNSELVDFFVPKEDTTISGTVDELGAVTIPQAGVYFPPAYIENPPLILKATIRAAGPSTGSINPATGAVELSVPLEVALDSAVGGFPSTCKVGPLTMDLTSGDTSPPGPNSPISGEEYSDDGTFTIVNNSFNAPAIPTGACFGLEGAINLALGLPSAPGRNTAVFVAQTDTVFVAPEAEPEPNVAPIADAGEDATVDGGDTVTLDGSASSDPDEGPEALTYSWEQIDGTTVELDDATSATPSFTAPGGPDELTFVLTVDDGEDTATDSVTITVAEPPAPNAAPVADAGEDQTVESGAVVTLDGSGSSDADDDPLTYSWTQTEGPEVELDGGDTDAPSFTAPEGPAELGFELTVSDGTDSDSDSVTVAVSAPVGNTAPVADAGPDQTTNDGLLVRLDGSGSSDADDDPLTYSWTQTGGAPVTHLTGADTATPSFGAPTGPDTVVFDLTVSDGTATATDSVTIEVTGPASGIVNPGPFRLAIEDGSIGIKATTFNLTPAELPQCSDGVNNDDGPPVQDTLIDYPADPQCTSPTDHSELAGGFQPLQDVVIAGTVNADGTITVPSAAQSTPPAEGGAGGIFFPPAYLIVANTLNGNAAVLTATIRPQAISSGQPFTGTLDPVTGELNITFAVRIQLQGNPGIDLTNSCYIGGTSGGNLISLGLTTGTTSPPAPNGPITGVPYRSNLGTVTLVNNSFAVPGADGCGFLGLANGGINSALGLPSTAGNNTAIFTLGSTPVFNERPNSAPVADAGTDVTGVVYGQTVSLDSSASTDPDGDPVRHRWTQTGGPEVALTGAATATPSFDARKVGTDDVLTFQVEATDGRASSTDTVTVTVDNQAPVADAGPDQDVVRRSTVTLDASASSDADLEDVLAYAWTQTDGPEVELDDATASGPTFTVADPELGDTYTFSVEVTDPNGASSSDTVTLTVVNEAPVADAGADQSVERDAAVSLDGTGSTDPDTDADLGYAWTQTAGTAVELDDATLATPSFTSPDGPTVPLVFELTVTDEEGAATSATVTVTVQNEAPVAAAGDDQKVGPGDVVVLDGSGSADADDDAITYAWAQTSGPAVELDDATSATPSFTAPERGNTVGFTLTVDDGAKTSTDSVSVKVPLIANPGSFRQELGAGAQIKIRNLTFSLSGGVLAGTIDEDGQISIPAGTLSAAPGEGETGIYLPSSPITVNTLTGAQIVFNTPNAVTGTLNPSTGVITLTVPIRPQITATSGLGSNTCFLGGANPVSIATTSANALGSAYRTNSGQSAPANNTFTVAALSTGSNCTNNTLRSNVGNAFGGFATPAGQSNLVLAGASVPVVNATPNAAPEADAGEDQAVALGATVSLSGSATDADGDPVTYSWTQVSGPEVTLSGAATANASFTASAPGELVFELSVSDGLATGTDTVTVTVARPDAIRGTVTSSAGGPIAGAKVDLYPAASATQLASIVADEDGTYVFDNTLDVGDYKVRISAPGHVTQWYTGATSFHTASVIGVSEADTATVDLALVAQASLGSLTGTIQGDGGPLEGISVQVYSDSSALRLATVLTGTDGSYTVGGLAPGSYRVRAVDPGGVHLTQWNGGTSWATATSVPVSAGDAATVDLTLVNPALSLASLGGTVTVSGSPLSGATVQLYDLGAVRLASTTTDTDGSYTFTNVEPGAYKVRVIDPSGATLTQWYGGAATHSSAPSFTVAAGESPSNLDVAMVPVATLATIGGSVTDGSDAITGARVYLYTPTAELVAMTTTSSSGEFSFANLEAGTYLVRVLDPVNTWYESATSWRQATPIVVTPGETESISVTVPLPV